MSHMPIHSIGDQNEVTRVQRGSTRKRTIDKAMLVFNAGNCTMACIVLDVSESGAKIRPTDLLTLPEQFEIRSKSGLSHACEIVRRSANYLGIRYLNAPAEGAQAS